MGRHILPYVPAPVVPEVSFRIGKEWVLIISVLFISVLLGYCWLYFAVRSANILALRNLSFFASAFVVDFLHWELLSSYLISPIASPIASPIGASGVFPGQVGDQMGKQLGTAISWNPWFSYTFGSSWFPPSSVLPISLYGVTTSLIVISSKSDKFFERHLPWSAFRSVHLRSVKSRLFFTVTSSRTVTPRDDTNYPQALEITGLSGRFGIFLLGVLQDERV